MAGFVFTAAVMFAFWVLLSGHVDFFHLFTGFLSSLLVAWFSHDLLVPQESQVSKGVARFFRFLRYLPWLLYEIIKANIDVAWRTLHPRMPIDPRIIVVDTDIKSELGTVTMGNSITLTPGTVTVAADPDGRFMVHAIAEEPAGSLAEGEMARRVRAVEGKDV